jgi:hypothetical protein
MKKAAARPRGKALKIAVKDLGVAKKKGSAVKGGFNPQPEPPTKVLKTSIKSAIRF